MMLVERSKFIISEPPAKTMDKLLRSPGAMLSRRSAIAWNILFVAVYVAIAILAPSPWHMMGAAIVFAVLIRCTTLAWIGVRSHQEQGADLSPSHIVSLVLVNLVLGLVFAALLVSICWWLGKSWSSVIRILVPLITVVVAYKSLFPLSASKEAAVRPENP